MIMSKFSLQDRVAIVTGAGRGIGKAIGIAFAEAGAHVVCCSRTAEQIESTAAEIRTLGRKSIAVPTDVRDNAQVEAMVKKTMDEFGRVDILVNNAGGSFPASALDLSERGWDSVITENLKPVFLCSKAVARIMIGNKKGAIVNISSHSGFIATPGFVAYAVSKAGIINLTKTLAVEWAPHVRVNCVTPSIIDTAGGKSSTQDPKVVQQIQAIVKGIPLGRIGKPEDVAAAALYLASDAADWVTGIALEVTGGPTKS